MNRVIISIAICLVGMLPSSGTSYAADLSLGIEGGISTVVGRSYGDYFDAGYSFGGNLFYPVHPNIALGGSVRSHSWKANSRPYQWTCADGSASVLEIMPAVRFQTSCEKLEPAVLFMQLGAGYASLDSDAVSWMIPDLPEDPVGPEEPVIGSQGNTVLSIGAGISVDTGFGFEIEFLPVFDYMFTEDDALMYLSADLGLTIAL